MAVPKQYNVGDIVKMKKQHPCGSDCWEVMRTGIDFGLKCQKCGRRILIPRPKFEKGVKAVVASIDKAKNELKE